jgi:hypothetical protein
MKNATGALVAGGSVFRMPGKKKDAGETDVLVLMPLQPAKASASVISIARPRKFQFNLTCPV